ncbi:unnamed protein product, partial [Mesorhabditis spiculigera]
MDDPEAMCYISNLSDKCTADLIEELFVQMGPVKKVVWKDEASHRYALVVFKDVESVLFAVEALDEIRLFGQPLSVKPKNGTAQYEKYEQWKRTQPARIAPPVPPPPPQGGWVVPQSRHDNHQPRRSYDDNHGGHRQNWGQRQSWGHPQSAPPHRHQQGNERMRDRGAPQRNDDRWKRPNPFNNHRQNTPSAMKVDVVKKKKALKVVVPISADAGVKKKRPWRNKARREAKKEAKKTSTDTEPVKTAPPATEAVTKIKKSRKGPKKREKLKKLHAQPEQTVEEKDAALKKLEYLNEQLYTMSGSDAYELFSKDPDAFHVYHSGYAEQTKKWPNHPLKYMIQWLSSKTPGLVVLDLGCGEAKLGSAVGAKHEVHSFDLVAVNDKVTACDMAKLPIEDGTADIAIFCLSLMGTNLAEYIREARRCLKENGILKIAEVSSRFTNTKLFCGAVCKLGFDLTEKKHLTDYFSMFEFVKTGKVESKKPFGLKLKPCLYKKR